MASRLAPQAYPIEEIYRITYFDQQAVKLAIQKYAKGSING